MIGFQDLNRFLAPIRRKIFLSIGRSIVAAINDSETTQKLQLKLLANEIATDVERFEEYGFSTYPWEDAEALALFINGNRDHGIVVKVHDRRYRPDYLTQGEVVVYTEEDSTTAFRIHLKRNGILNIKCTDLDVDVGGDETKDVVGDSTDVIGGNKSVTIDGNKSVTVGGNETTTITGVKTVTVGTVLQFLCGTSFTVKIGGSTLITTDGTNVLVGGSGVGSLRRFVDERLVTLFNNHVHSGITAGGANSGAPTTTMSTGSHCSDTLRGI
jgi:phage baseplate assembly protein V